MRNRITWTVKISLTVLCIMGSCLAFVRMIDLCGELAYHTWPPIPPTQIHIVYDDDPQIRPVERDCKPFRIMDATGEDVFEWVPGPDCETGGHIRLGRYYMPQTNVPPDLDGYFPVPGPPEDTWMGNR